MRRSFQIILNAPGARHWGVILAELAAGLTEGIGIVTLLPIVTLVTSADQESSSPLHRLILSGFEEVGLKPSLGLLLVIFAVAMCLRSALQMLAMWYVGYAAAEVSTQLRHKIIRSVLNVRWRFLVDQPLGRVANALSNDSTRAGKCYVHTAMFVAQFVKASVFVAIAFIVSFNLAIAGFVAGLAVAGALHFLVRIARKAGWRQTARTQQLISFLSDTLNNIKPIKAMAREAPFGALLERRTKQLRNSLRLQVVTTEALGNAQDMLVAILLSLGFYVAVEVFQAPIAEVLVMGLVILRLISSVGRLQTAYQKAAVLESAFLACQELITAAEDEVEPNPGRVVPSFEQGLILDAVTFRHGESTILNSLTLEIPVGSLTVLTGASGSGKTTITDLIIGLHTPQVGQILVDGCPMQELDQRKWRQMLGYVPQEQTLLHDTITTNVTLGDQTIPQEEVEKALRLAGAWDFACAQPQGLNTIVGEKGARLSGGQRQRVGLARALVVRPRLLILDEVTSALDQATALTIAQEIKRLSRKVTVLAVTHRGELLDVADRVYSLDNGRLSNITADYSRLSRAR